MSYSYNFSFSYDNQMIEGNRMKNKMQNFLILMGIGTIVTVVWQTIELKINGKITPNDVDSIIGVILTCSLYLNFKNWKN